MTIDPVTGPSFTIGIGSERSFPSLLQLFTAIQELSKNVSIVIILDEFQDIHFVDEAAGILRDCFQNLTKNTSIIVSGSKKHILATMFGRSRSAFSGFGHDLEFKDIPYDEYTNYINERFARVLYQRQGRFEETLSQYNVSESKVLTVIAKSNGIEKPSGKDFVAQCGLSPRGVKKIMEKLLNAAEIYHWHDRFILAEPLLHHYLRHYR